MRITASIVASVQHSQAREKNDISRNYEKNVESKKFENDSFAEISDKRHNDRVAQIKEEIKNGTYQINLAATAERMAQSLLNV